MARVAKINQTQSLQKENDRLKGAIDMHIEDIISLEDRIEDIYSQTKKQITRATKAEVRIKELEDKFLKDSCSE